MKTRQIGILTLTVAVLTVIWVALFVYERLGAQAVYTLADRVAAIERNVGLHVLIYTNSGLLTLTGVAMLAGLYLYCREENPLWGVVALVLIPIYGLANLVVYLSQVFVVPGLLELYHQPETAAVAEILLGLTIHDWPGSVAGFVNALAYAVLGIASIILGLMMYRKSSSLRAGGVMLAISGILSIIALVGVGIHNALLAFMSPVGGFVYLIALSLLGVKFIRQPEPEARSHLTAT